MATVRPASEEEIDHVLYLDEVFFREHFLNNGYRMTLDIYTNWWRQDPRNILLLETDAGWIVGYAVSCIPNLDCMMAFLQGRIGENRLICSPYDELFIQAQDLQGDQGMILPKVYFAALGVMEEYKELNDRNHIARVTLMLIHGALDRFMNGLEVGGAEIPIRGVCAIGANDYIVHKLLLPREFFYCCEGPSGHVYVRHFL